MYIHLWKFPFHFSLSRISPDYNYGGFSTSGFLSPKNERIIHHFILVRGFPCDIRTSDEKKSCGSKPSINVKIEKNLTIISYINLSLLDTKIYIINYIFIKIIFLNLKIKNLDLVLLLAEFFSNSANFSIQSSTTIDSRAPIFSVPAHHAGPVHQNKNQFSQNTKKSYMVPKSRRLNRHLRK